MLNNVQVLRAFAALGVVLVHESIFNHSVLDQWLAFGLYGVDVFFVISGFVMVYTIERRSTSSFSFFLNRVIRIAPLYWSMTIAIFVIAFFCPDLLKATKSNISDLIRSILFIPFYKGNGLIQPLLNPGWTLNYEMFFYALIALSLLVKGKANRTLIVLNALIGLAAVGAVFSPTFAVGKFYTSSIVLEFGYGMLIGRAFPRLEEINASVRVGVALTILSALLLILLPTFVTISNRAFMLGVPATLLVLGAILLEIRGIRVTSPTLLLMGSASYAVYLIHPFVLAAVQLGIVKLGLMTGGPSLIAALVAGILITLVVGIVVHLGFERPVDRFLKRRFSPTQRPSGMRETLALWPWKRGG